MRTLVTGGAGFIGSAVCRHLINFTNWSVLNLDKLTYAANLASLSSIADSPRYSFVKGDIADSDLVRSTLESFRPDAILHLAAETHVDRSIDTATEFINTNINGTFVLLEEARRYYDTLPPDRLVGFRLTTSPPMKCSATLAPPVYSSRPHLIDPRHPMQRARRLLVGYLVRAWHRTYGLPVLISNCSNNYGPYQFPEKLIPLMILRALKGEFFTGLRQGRQHPRLAQRRGPRACAPDHSRASRTRFDLQHWLCL